SADGARRRGGDLRRVERDSRPDDAARAPAARRPIRRSPEAERRAPAADAGQLYRDQSHPRQGGARHDGPDRGSLPTAPGADEARESRQARESPGGAGTIAAAEGIM